MLIINLLSGSSLMKAYKTNFYNIIYNFYVLAIIINFSIYITSILLGSFFFNKFLLIFDFILISYLIFFLRYQFKPIKIDIIFFVFVLFFLIILVIALGYSFGFPIRFADFTRYHLKVPLYWIDQNTIFGENIFLEQKSMWGLQHLVYSRFFFIFDHFKFVLFFNTINLFILLPISIFLIGNYFTKVPTLYLLPLSLSLLTFEYTYMASFRGDETLITMVYLFGFILFIEKYCSFKKKEYLLLAIMSLISMVSMKIIAVIFIPLVIIYSFYRSGNIFIFFIVLFTIFLGTVKYSSNYLKYKNFFFPFEKSIPFVNQVNFEPNLIYHNSCNSGSERFCISYFKSYNKKNFIENIKEILKIMFDNKKNQMTKSKNTGVSYKIILFSAIILLLLLIFKNYSLIVKWKKK